MQPDTSFYAALAGRLEGRTAAIVLSSKDVSLTGPDLLSKVEIWAAALAGNGVQAGDRVAVQVEKSMEVVLLYLAVLRLGAVYVPLNTAYRSAEVAYFLADAEPRLLVCDPADAVAHAQHGVSLLTLDKNGRGSLADTVVADHPQPPRHAAIADDLAAIVYTSGTTGRSKGAMITHRNLLSNALALIATWRIDPKDTLLHVLPLYHIHGLFIALNTMLLATAHTRLLTAFDAEAVFTELPDATVFMGVPTYYTRLLADQRLDRSTTAGVRLFVCGSAPLTPATFDAFHQRTGQQILERYGMSECGVICSNPIDGPRLAGAVGPPLPGTEVRLSGGGERGVLEVRGDNVCAGYWRQPDKTAAEFLGDGFFITGDIATIDDDGVVRIVGREKDLIISGGLNIYPKEIELVIDLLDEVDEAAVIGLPHADFGEAVIALVRLNPGASLDQAALIERLRPVLAGFKLPKAVFIVDELPRNAMGKVQKALLREQFTSRFKG
ncbi:AMP-binding protein [Glacieibacterium sp.]|uniref:AMP-binding protein n=1 Tax=Glacieibacterium sp. TaxID=2860237 RepID=UPI003B00CB50